MLKGEACEIHSVRGDGNCLFAAAAHQLFGFEMGSTMHEAMVTTLSEMVVEFIRDHKSNLELQI